MKDDIPEMFDFIESINNHKVDLMNSDLAEKSYDAFMIRRGLSMSNETVFFAGRMNELHNLDSYTQYQYLLKSVPKKKRYTKWTKKPVVSDDIKVISDYYNVSMSKATGYRKLLNNDQVETIKTILKGGGKQ